MHQAVEEALMQPTEVVPILLNIPLSDAANRFFPSSRLSKQLRSQLCSLAESFSRERPPQVQQVLIDEGADPWFARLAQGACQVAGLEAVGFSYLVAALLCSKYSNPLPPPNRIGPGREARHRFLMGERTKEVGQGGWRRGRSRPQGGSERLGRGAEQDGKARGGKGRRMKPGPVETGQSSQSLRLTPGRTGERVDQTHIPASRKLNLEKGQNEAQVCAAGSQWAGRARHGGRTGPRAKRFVRKG